MIAAPSTVVETMTGMDQGIAQVGPARLADDQREFYTPESEGVPACHLPLSDDSIRSSHPNERWHECFEVSFCA